MSIELESFKPKTTPFDSSSESRFHSYLDLEACQDNIEVSPEHWYHVALFDFECHIGYNKKDEVYFVAYTGYNCPTSYFRRRNIVKPTYNKRTNYYRFSFFPVFDKVLPNFLDFVSFYFFSFTNIDYQTRALVPQHVLPVEQTEIPLF